MLLAIILVAMVLIQVRNQKMKEKYAALWIIVSTLIIVLAVFPRLLAWLSEMVGVETPVNLLFLLAIVMLIGVSLHLTQAISKLTEDTRTLAEEVAIMRLGIDRHQESIDSLKR